MKNVRRCGPEEVGLSVNMKTFFFFFFFLRSPEFRQKNLLNVAEDLFFFLFFGGHLNLDRKMLWILVKPFLVKFGETFFFFFEFGEFGETFFFLRLLKFRRKTRLNVSEDQLISRSRSFALLFASKTPSPKPNSWLPYSLKCLFFRASMSVLAFYLFSMTCVCNSLS